MSTAKEVIKEFVFTSRSRNTEPSGELLILIPELLKAEYSFYTWPCAPVLAWYLWERRHTLPSKRILEIGCGTSLPGILAAKCGALVTLSDCATLPNTLKHIERCCLVNALVPNEDIKIFGLTWGLITSGLFQIGPFDLIIASDCFYDPSVFENVLVTISFLLDRSPQTKFLCTYQERSTDWSIEALLKKWKLQCCIIDLEPVGKDSGVDLKSYMNGHTIHLLQISRN